MKIIMVCGVIGSGKDYFLEQYKKEHPDEDVVEIKFAEPLKAIIGNMYSIDISDKDKYEEWKNKPENRLLLQNLAEGIKDNLSQTIFAKKAVDRMNKLDIKLILFYLVFMMVIKANAQINRADSIKYAKELTSILHVKYKKL